jgi:flagellar export protein FliJ
LKKPGELDVKVLQFRLATLLRLREAVRDERRRQLAETLREADAIVARCDAIDGELERLKHPPATSAATVNVDRLLDADRYEALLRLECGQIDEQRKAIEVEIEKRREALLAADRDVRALEQLYETHERRRLAEEERRRMKELDETAQLRHVASNVRGGDYSAIRTPAACS